MLLLTGVIEDNCSLVADSGYDIGVVWVNTTTKKGYLLTDNTQGAAVWKQILTTEDVSGAGDMLKVCCNNRSCRGIC